MRNIGVVRISSGRGNGEMSDKCVLHGHCGERLGVYKMLTITKECVSMCIFVNGKYTATFGSLVY